MREAIDIIGVRADYSEFFSESLKAVESGSGGHLPDPLLVPIGKGNRTKIEELLSFTLQKSIKTLISIHTSTPLVSNHLTNKHSLL
jgi:hypothetical protein